MKLTDEERQKLYENFATYDILDAIEHYDTIRGMAADWVKNEREVPRPPEIRDKILKLHGIAHGEINGDYSNHTKGNMFHIAMEIEDDIENLIEHAEAIRDTMRKLTDLAPDRDGFWENED